MSGDRRFRRLFRLPGRRGIAEDVDEEVEFHLSMVRRDLEEEGWDPEDARAEALRRFGDRAVIEREMRRIGRRREGEMRIVDFVDVVRQDLGFALRQLVRRPGASALSVLTLMLGVAATAVVFSVVDAVVLEPLPFDDPDELVVVRGVTPQGEEFSQSEPNFVDFRERQRSFTELGAIGWETHILSREGEVESVAGMRISHTVLPLLGLTPVVGRGFLPEEDVKDGRTQVALLSQGTWRRRFGGDQDIVGRRIELDGEPHTVVGVVPTALAWPGVEVFTPLAPEAVLERENRMVEILGRLAPGVTMAEARRDVAAIAEGLAETYPETSDGWSATVVGLREQRIGPRLTRLGYLLLGAVGLLLLMACASISNIQVARATSRLQEMGVRAAMGAGKQRILGQLLTEGLLLALLGGGLGVAAAYWALPLVRALGPADVARLSQASMDGTVLAVALGASVLAVMLSGLAPALLVTRSSLFQALRAGAVHLAGQGRRTRDALVMAQFALAVVVVLGAGLMTRSFLLLQDVDLGFEPRGMIHFSLPLPEDRYHRMERGPFVRRVKEELEGLPGVEAVGVTQAPPFSPFRPSNFVAPSDNEPDRQEHFVPISWRAIAGDYFRASGIRLLSGRTFGPEDVPGPDDSLVDGSLPIILDRALAEALWPGGEDPIGRSVTWFQPGNFHMRVVGVVAAARDEYVDGDPRPRLYLPYEFAPWDEPTLVVRSAGDPDALAPGIREVVASLDPGMPVIDLTPVREDLRETVAWPRFSMQVLAAFGIVALILAAMGIYGVTAFTVARRRQEIGVRVALGADPGSVVGMVLSRALRLAAVGITVGLLVAVAAARVLDSLLYGISPTDPATFVLVSAFLAAVAAMAAFVPARRATRVDPREALVAE